MPHNHVHNQIKNYDEMKKQTQTQIKCIQSIVFAYSGK